MGENAHSRRKRLLEFPRCGCYAAGTTMKRLLLLSTLVLALAGTSCRTMSPLDPMTMKPSDKCLPAGSGSTTK